MTCVTVGRIAALASGAVLLSATFASAKPDCPECLAPAQPGGSFDITCKLAQAALTETEVLPPPLRV